MPRYVFIDSTKTVVDMLMAEDYYPVPPGLSMVPSDTAGIGDNYSDGVFTTPVPVVTLLQAQVSQLAVLAAGYQNAIVQPVSYTSKAGVAKTYQADAVSVANVQATIAGLSAAAATPTGFYWVASDNTQVPYTYADVQGLAAAMLSQGWAAFAHLQTQKAAVNAASTVAAVQGVVW